MKRIQVVGLLAFTSILLVLASAMVTILKPAELRDDNGGKSGEHPRSASYVDYLYTIGMSGAYGSDNSHLYYPHGAVINSTGYVYVVDYNNHRIQVFDKAGIYSYTIGTGLGTGNYQFNYPTGVAVNSTGHVYVADQSNHRVQVYDKAGIYQYTLGVTGVSGSDNAHFNMPYGVAVNSTGHLYVSESNNHRVQVFNNAGVYQYTITSSFNGPSGIAVNSTGHLIVADTANHRVQVFDKAGIWQYTIGGSGFGTGNYKFHSPSGIAVNSTGHFYVADEMNHRVQVFDSAGIYQYTMGITGLFGTGNDRFYNPLGVAVNSTNHVYVVDTDNHRVQVFNNGTPTSLTISINGGQVDTGSISVTLTVSAHDATEMCFSNNGTTYTSWEPYSTTKAWMIDNIAGVRTVYFKAKNVHGESGPVTDSITYVLAPTGLSLLINGGATETGSTSVTLTPSATGATQMCFSNNGTSYTIWETYGTSKAWTLVGGPGPKTVYFKARNSTYEASPVTAGITYILQPFGLSIIIDGGAADTSNTSVTLTLGATGATEMCFSNNGTTYTAWEVYSPTRTWVLDGGPGIKTVYFNVRNSSIEAAVPVSDNITYILPPTGLSISINSGAEDTGSASVLLTLSAMGATEMCFSNNGTTYTAWEAYSTSKTWTLDNIPGNRTVFFKVKNGSIEAATPANDSVNFVAPPFALLIINDGVKMTDTRSVTLVIWAWSADEMRFSNDGTNWYGWEPLSTIKFWGLWGGPGPKTVYLQVRNKYFTANAYDSITYTLPPTELSITINGGATETGSSSVTLTISASGAEEMCFSNDGAAWSAWEPYGTSKAWVLSSSGGPKTVHFRVRNGTIEAAEPVATNITYLPPADVPAWVLLLAAIGATFAIIYMLRRQGGGRVLPPEMGGEKKDRLGFLKGKMSQLKGKILKKDSSSIATGKNEPADKTTGVTPQPPLEPKPKPAPTPLPEKKVEVLKPIPTSLPEKKVVAPEPVREIKAEGPKPIKKVAKKTSKKAAKKIE